MRALLSALALLLVACGPAADEPTGDTQTIPFAEATRQQAQAVPSPDTSGAFWQVAANGQAVAFGNTGEPPLLTLACDLSDAAAPQFAIIRHAEALPGQSALFPFVSDGMSRRFLADTVLVDGEWRWEAKLPAASAELEIFEEPGAMTATLPGHGMLELRESRIPAEFLAWCRAGGQTPQTVSESASDAQVP